jgi:small-conductance mechanosensitive channel
MNHFLKVRFLVAPLLILASFLPSIVRAEPCHEASLAGVVITCFDKGVGSFSATDRASAIQSKVEKLSEDHTFDTDKLTVQDQESNSDIVAGDIVIASLRKDDLGKSGAKDVHALAEIVVNNIRLAIKEDRHLKSPKEFLRGALYAVALTLALGLLLFLLSLAFQRVYALIRRGEGGFIPSFRIQSFEILTSKRFAEVLIWLAQAARVLLSLVIFYVYIPLVLSFFPETSNFAPKLYGYIENPFRVILKVVVDYIPSLFFIIVIAAITRYLLKLVRFIFDEIEQETIKLNGFYKEWADPTYKLVRILILAFAAVMAFPYIPGSGSPAFQGITVFIGILVSLGSSSAIGNIVAGIVLTYMRPFKVGDRVEISGTVGDVVEKTLLVTRILTIKNVDITVPNSLILSGHILNYSTRAQDKGIILNTTITIGYDAPWAKVHELLKKAALMTTEIEKNIDPFVLQTSLDDFYVSYQLNAYTRSPNKMAIIYSELHQNIQNCFNSAGVEIMSPHYGSLRDGNEVTIPETFRDKSYRSPKFNVRMNSVDRQE